MKIRLLHTTIFLTTSFILMQLLYHITRYVMLLILDFEDVGLNFSTVIFDPYKYETWSRTKIAIVYAFPTIIMLIPILLSTYYILLNTDKNYKSKIFSLSILLSASSFFLSDFLKAPFVRTDIAAVYAWFFLPFETSLYVAFAFFVFFPILGWLTIKDTLRTANEKKYIKDRFGRIGYYVIFWIPPFFISSIIFIILTLLTPFYDLKHYFANEFIRFVVMFVILLFGIFFSKSMHYLELDYKNSYYKLNKTNLIVIVSFLLLTYLMLNFF